MAENTKWTSKAELRARDRGVGIDRQNGSRTARCRLRSRLRSMSARGLKRRCEELLRQAEARVDKITTDASGQVTGTEPLDVQ